MEKREQKENLKRLSKNNCHFRVKHRLATSRPLGERSEPCLAAKWPTVSDEVARDRPSSRAIWNPTKDFFESLGYTKCGIIFIFLAWPFPRTSKMKIQQSNVKYVCKILELPKSLLRNTHTRFSPHTFKVSRSWYRRSNAGLKLA